jgi:beta-glucosidase
MDNEAKINELISQMTLEEKVSQLSYTSAAIPRLGIPEYNWWNECLHGVARAGIATVFPQAIALAATFDETFIEEVASAISDEARAKYNEAVKQGNRGQYWGLTFWTPNINIFRDPRWGRGQETYGEDPYLTGRIGTAFVRGLQGNDPENLKTAACAKHYAVHSGPEKLRHTFDAVVSKKDLFETYLPAFKALVEAGVESVMGAYNRTLGEPCCGSNYLLKDILRGKWGFKGHVVSDCWAIRDFHEHHKVTETPEESAALALNSGCDLNCGCTYPMLTVSLKKGLVTEEAINTALRRECLIMKGRVNMTSSTAR